MNTSLDVPGISCHILFILSLLNYHLPAGLIAYQIAYQSAALLPQNSRPRKPVKGLVFQALSIRSGKVGPNAALYTPKLVEMIP